MPRTGRMKTETGYYHVMVRGDNQKRVFDSVDGKTYLLERLEKLQAEGGWALKGYCIMDNHVHLLIKEESEPLARIMKRLNTSYAMYYNKQHEMVGHVFQDRYKSQQIEDEAQLISALRYIHQNPVKAGIVEGIDQYPWSSYKAYLSNQSKQWLPIQDVLDLFGTTKIKAKKEYIKFHQEETNEIWLEESEEEKAMAIAKLDEIRQYWQDQELPPKEKRNHMICQALKEVNLSRRQLAEHLEIDRGVIQRVANKMEISQLN